MQFSFHGPTANAYFGYWQEGRRTSHGIAKANVGFTMRRSSDSDIEIPTLELVPGDIANLYEDLTFQQILDLESYQCKIDESALTENLLLIRTNP